MMGITDPTQIDLVNTLPLSPNEPNARVLIVDDEADIRHALARILRLEGYVAEEAGSGSDALNLVKNEAYDLMVLDMRMPKVGGIEVLKRVRKDYPALFIIVLTGQATLESAILATKSDRVVDYLLKPVSHEEFVSAVSRALQIRTDRLRQQKLASAAAQMLNAVQQPAVASGAETLFLPHVQPDPERFLHVYPLTLDRQKRLTTMLDESPARMIELTKGETAVLSTLMMHPNQVLSCHELVTYALRYEIDEAEAESVIRPYIFRLRRKLEPSPKKPSLICTVRRRGYRFATGQE